MLIAIGALILGAAAGAYAESKFGAKAKMLAAEELAAAKIELTRVKSAAAAVATDAKKV